MGYRRLIWDWNGTLLDDAWLSVEVMSQLRQSRGLAPLGGDEYQQLFGFPLKDYCVRLGFAPEQFASLTAEFSHHYEARRLECSLQAQARQVLAAVQAGGRQQAVLSAYQESYLTQIIDHYGLSGHFAAVAGLENAYAEGKAARGQRLLAELGWDPAEVLLVGDTDHDFEVAALLEVACVLFPSGHQHARRLQARGAILVETLDQVLGFLDS